MDTSRSPMMAPVCARLKSMFEPAASALMPVDLCRLLEALDEAYARGELLSPSPACAGGSFPRR
jgi:hypothetical protein